MSAVQRWSNVTGLPAGSVQIGDNASAKAQVDALAAVQTADADPEYKDYYQDHQALAPATYAIERRQWKEALALQPLANAPPYVQLVTYWARAIAAGHLRDTAVAQDVIKHADELIEATRKSDKPYFAADLKEVRDVMQAWTDFASGKNDEAQRLLRAVADKQDKIGKGETDARPRNARRPALRNESPARRPHRIRNFSAHRPQSLQRPLRRRPSRRTYSTKRKSSRLLRPTPKKLRRHPLRPREWPKPKLSSPQNSLRRRPFFCSGRP